MLLLVPQLDIAGWGIKLHRSIGQGNDYTSRNTGILAHETASMLFAMRVPVDSLPPHFVKYRRDAELAMIDAAAFNLSGYLFKVFIITGKPILPI